jgi:hypothetical protein
MADNDKEREAFLIKIGQVKPKAEAPKPKPTVKKDEE